MRSIRGRRPSPSLVIALLALFVSLGGTSYAAANLIQGSTGEDLVTLQTSEERFPPAGYSPAEPGGNPGGDWTVSPNATTTVRDLVGRLESAPGAGTGGRAFQIFNVDANAVVLSCLVSGTATTCDSGAATGTLPPKTRYTMRIFNGNPSSGPSSSAAWSFRLVTP
jgi:hypothetical protein